MLLEAEGVDERVRQLSVACVAQLANRSVARMPTEGRNALNTRRHRVARALLTRNSVRDRWKFDLPRFVRDQQDRERPAQERAREDEVGDEFLEVLKEQTVVDASGWSVQWARRVGDRLNQVRQPRRAIQPVIYWSQRARAFTVPGSYLFVSRELLQRLRTDEAVAFVFAHEMAHHDLGHLTLRGSTLRLPLTVLWLRLQHKLAGPERELDADALALKLCVAAGFAGRKCIDAFDVFEELLLSAGDIEGVFGVSETLSKWQRWYQERRRGYTSLDDRRARLSQLLDSAA